MNCQLLHSKTQQFILLVTVNDIYFTGLSPRVMPLTSNNNNIKHIPFAFDLVTLLPKSHQTELLFSMLIQDLTPSLSHQHDWFSDLEHISNKPNEMLFDQLLAELENVNGQEGVYIQDIQIYTGLALGHHCLVDRAGDVFLSCQ